MVLVIDPFSKESGLTPPRGEAQLVLSTNTNPEHSNVNALGGSPFVISTPGEFEVQGIFIQGIPTEANGTQNTCYLIEWEDIKICHLGNIAKASLTEEVKEAIGTPDILFVPIGGAGALDAEEATSVTSQIEPRVVIPMRYHVQGLKTKLEEPKLFIKEVGDENSKPEEKFVFKKKDLPQEQTTTLVYLAHA